MYTEIVIKADIRKDITEKEKEILNYLFNYGDFTNPPKELPNHPFFETSRWRAIGSSNSYYHVPWSNSKYEDNYIFSRSDMKNYDNEIEKFFDWFRPLVNADPAKCIGWSWYEEDDAPTLIYKKISQ